MTNQTQIQLQETYTDLICEAFIAPVRNVTVIDDEYPTLQGFLEKQLQDDGQIFKPKQLEPKNIDRLKRILNMCRETHKWSVDVYDGQTPKLGALTEFPEHLNHSDLLILDYHLDGEPDKDDGTRARKIVEHLVKNNHYNLVVIHTKGHEDDISQVFGQVLKDLYKTPDLLNKFTDDSAVIEEWIDEPESDEAILFLDLKVSFLDIASFFNTFDQPYNYNDPAHIFNQFKEEIKYISAQTQVSLESVISWKYRELIGVFENTDFSDIKWSFDQNVNFISTGKAFITVVKKSDEEPVELLYEKLTEALIKHNPPPIMLLLAKIRYELDENGLEQANNILYDDIAQSGWLKDIFKADLEDDYKHLGAISRHWEQLSNASKEPLIDFSKRMYKSIKAGGSNINDLIGQFFPSASTDELMLIKHLNAYICSYPVNSRHLTTGTILKLLETDEYWLCLTPACDLVPSQARKKWEQRLGDKHVAFQAIQLHKVDTPTSNKAIKSFKAEIQKNEHIFIKENNEVSIFRFTKDSKASPVWETFYALNHGYYADSNILEVQHLRSNLEHSSGISEKSYLEPLNLEPTLLRLVRNKSVLKFTDTKRMHAISSLRYEYALNLLQKFGSNQSRVGLDFISDIG